MCVQGGHECSVERDECEFGQPQPLGVVDGQHDRGVVVWGIGRAQRRPGLLVELDPVVDDGSRCDGRWYRDKHDEWRPVEWDLVLSCANAGCCGQLGGWCVALWAVLDRYDGALHADDPRFHQTNAFAVVV